VPGQGGIGQAVKAGRLTVASSPLNGVVRSLLTSPERSSFKPTRPRTSCNTLISQAFNNRTKMGVVRLCQRTGARETKNGPKNGAAGRRAWFGQMAAKVRILRDSDRSREQEKECSGWRDWRRDRNCRRNLSMVESRRGAVFSGRRTRLPSPLVKPDVRISRIRLSDWLHRKAHGSGPK
jgi:hypothetical protein